MEREEESLCFFLGGFNYFFKVFTRKIGEVSHFEEYFSNGLVQTPTSFSSEPLFFLLDVHITMEKKHQPFGKKTSREGSHIPFSFKPALLS